VTPKGLEGPSVPPRRAVQAPAAKLADAVSVVHAVRVPGAAAAVTSLPGDDVIGDVTTTSLAELACKLTCNVVTTCAFVRLGKVCGNFMVDLAVR